MEQTRWNEDTSRDCPNLPVTVSKQEHHYVLVKVCNQIDPRHLPIKRRHMSDSQRKNTLLTLSRFVVI